MQRVEVAGGGVTRPYLIGEGLLRELPSLLRAEVGAGRLFVVSDSNVGPLYGAALARELEAAYHELPAGERYKRWEAVDRLTHWLLTEGADRGSTIVAVGGGVLTDVAGFAAAILLRGVGWVAVPTTLVGMVDAAVGGKTGIDVDLGKNLLGAFWPPRAIFADPSALATLDGRQLRAGLAEVVKSAMVAPATLTHELEAHLARLGGGDPSRSTELIVGCARVKADVVAADEREAGPRRALNLGHTLGHALEAATDYGAFLHGEAVAWGLLAELRIAVRRRLIAEPEATVWARRLEAVAPLPPIAGLELEHVRSFISRDKKRRDGRVGWVLPRSGGVVIDVDVADQELADVWQELVAVPPAGPFAVLTTERTRSRQLGQ